MSEILTTQELTALKEMPSSMEMGTLRKITTLQDIPLAEGDSLQQEEFQHSTDIETESKLKSNSLKRFFRLPMKKKTEEACLEAATSHKEFSEAKAANMVDNTKDITASFSKANLKTSLSCYWNKLKKSKKSSKSPKELDLPASSSAKMEHFLTNSDKDLSLNEVSDHNDSKDSSGLEEIHSLKISEETQPKN